MFSVGTKVCCVDDTWLDPDWAFTPNKPVKGGIYTIRGMSDWWRDGDLGLVFEELINPTERWEDGDDGEVHFWASRFRPIVSRKTSIEIFQRMLTPKKELAR